MLGTLILVACGAVDAGVVVEEYRRASEAFQAVFSEAPLIVGVGEYHALKNGPKVATAIRHFTSEALPVLDGGAASLVVETWMTHGRCGKVEQRAVKAVERVTQRPAETEDEVTTMMNRASDLGLKNHTLLISCDDYAALLDGEGNLDAEQSLLMMRRKVEDLALSLREKGEAGVPGKMLLLYGGALHNDLHPVPDEAAYAFGQSLDAETKGGYLELDLLVPEFVERDPELTAFPWFPRALDIARRGRVALVRRFPGVRVMVFPYSRLGKRPPPAR